MRPYANTHKRARAQTHTITLTHTQKHTNTYAHSHTYIHAQSAEEAGDRGLYRVFVGCPYGVRGVCVLLNPGLGFSFTLKHTQGA